MAAKKNNRAKPSKATRAKATKKSSVRSKRKAPGLPPVLMTRPERIEIRTF